MRKKYVFYGVIVVVLSFLFGIGSRYQLEKKVPEVVNKIVEGIPEFSLSTKGFDFKEDSEYVFSFAGRDFYITDKETVSAAIVNNQGKENIFIIAKDGYAEVERNVVKLAKNFEYVSLLDDIVIEKSDVGLFEGIASIHMNTMLWIKSMLLGLFFIAFQLIVVITTRVAMNMCGKLLKRKYVDNTVAFKQCIITSLAIASGSVGVMFFCSEINLIAFLTIYMVVQIVSILIFIKKSEKTIVEKNMEGETLNEERGM